MARRLILILIALLVLGGLFFALRPKQPASGPQARIVQLTIQGSKMAPAEVTVDEGDQVTLRITTDHPIEFHLHGYDLEQALKPGAQTAISFEATLTGRFEIEDEKTRARLGTLIVQPR